MRFSKSAIQPNPIETDYWIDIKTDPYGGTWKYYDEHNWVEFNYNDKHILELIEALDIKIAENRENIFQLNSHIEKVGQYGETRPKLTKNDVGFNFFDTTLNKPIWWRGDKWIDANGDIVRNPPVYSLPLYGQSINTTINREDASDAYLLIITVPQNSSMNLTVTCYRGNIVQSGSITQSGQEFELPFNWEKIDIRGTVTGNKTLIELYDDGDSGIIIT